MNDPDGNEAERVRCMQVSHERGDFVMGDDGYYVFWPDKSDGALAPHHLRWLADELDRLNEAWDKQVREQLEGLG